MNATPIFAKYEIPVLEKTFFEAEEDLRSCALKHSHNFLNDIHTCIDAKILAEFNIEKPKAIEGIIASGDCFVASKDDLKHLHPDIQTDAVEMEGAAVAQVCEYFNMPFVVIRTISDKANSDAHIDFPKFTKLVASHYSFEILKSMSNDPLLQPLKLD